MELISWITDFYMYMFQEEEGDYMAKLSKLINGIGVNLIISWQK